ncbi:uncharacterized protein LOC142775310 [Rhipicephalus microplus]|uniref:uncharacterized protein LOC142775310 n=1 Tax=Rhipicephalus microplus TaxID=6941 RepID=UPI003F6B2C2A
MKPYAMVLPSTALFGSSFGSLFLKTIGSSNASLLLILVFAFVITYSIGYLFMRRPDMTCGSERASCSAGSEQRTKESSGSSANGPTSSSGGRKDETTPLLEGSGDEDDEEEEEEHSSSESAANEKGAN